MVIHANRHPSSQHVRKTIVPTCSELAAIEHVSEDEECGRRDITLCHHRQLNASGNEILDIINVNHRASDPLCYVLHFPYGRDGLYPKRVIAEDSAARRKKTTPAIF